MLRELAPKPLHRRGIFLLRPLQLRGQRADIRRDYIVQCVGQVQQTAVPVTGIQSVYGRRGESARRNGLPIQAICGRERVAEATPRRGHIPGRH